MKKIALISYHNEPNYGTMLQAYALYKAVYKLGFDSEYISYRAQACGWLHYWMLLKKIIRNPSIILNRVLRKSTKPSEFSFFKTDDFKMIVSAYNQWYQEYIPHTSITYTHQNIASIEKEYDSFIVGSDQTWSPYRNSTYPSFYFNYLQFIKEYKKKNAYAPSFGTLSLSGKYCNKIQYQLRTFNSVSCRERKNADYLSTRFNISMKFVLDPTLLISSEEWNEVAQPVQMPSRYILCYILGEKECISRFAEKLGQENRIPVYYILTRPYYLKKSNLLNNVGPGEFLSLIRNASCVCTDSFHGTIFSINYNVPFYSFTKRVYTDTINDNDRIQEVLSEFNLLHRFRSDNDYNTTNIEINYCDVNKCLERLKKYSNKYLKTILDA